MIELNGIPESLYRGQDRDTIRVNKKFVNAYNFVEHIEDLTCAFCGKQILPKWTDEKEPFLEKKQIYYNITRNQMFPLHSKCAKKWRRDEACNIHKLKYPKAIVEVIKHGHEKTN